jgi:hypothetical protein
VAQFGGILFRYLLFRMAHDPEMPAETLPRLQSILVGKILGLALGAGIGWAITGSHPLWLVLVCGLVSSSQCGMIGSSVVHGLHTHAIPSRYRRLVYAYYATNAVGVPIGVAGCAWLALFMPNLTLMYLVVSLGALLGTFAGEGFGLLLGIVPPWAVRARASWSYRRRATRRYPVTLVFQDLLAALEAYVRTPAEGGGEYAVERDMAAAVADTEPSEDPDWNGELTEDDSSAGLDESVVAASASPGGLVPARLAQSAPDATDSQHLNRVVASQADPKWRAAESNLGMVVGLVVGACGGYSASIAGALVLGQLIPALRRLVQTDRLATTVVAANSFIHGRTQGSPEMRLTAATTIGEAASLLLGGLLGLAVALATRYPDGYVVVTVGASCAYNSFGGAGYFLASAAFDRRMPSGALPSVGLFYSIRAVVCLLTMALGLAWSAHWSDPLVTLLSGSVSGMVSGMAASWLCAVFGIVPLWHSTFAMSRGVLSWAARSYQPTQSRPALASEPYAS